jgi:hypothetical protein
MKSQGYTLKLTKMTKKSKRTHSNNQIDTTTIEMSTTENLPEISKKRLANDIEMQSDDDDETDKPLFKRLRSNDAEVHFSLLPLRSIPSLLSPLTLSPSLDARYFSLPPRPRPGKRKHG